LPLAVIECRQETISSSFLAAKLLMLKLSLPDSDCTLGLSRKGCELSDTYGGVVWNVISKKKSILALMTSRNNIRVLSFVDLPRNSLMMKQSTRRLASLIYDTK